MNKDSLHQRLKLIEDKIKEANAAIEQQLANLNMLLGGKQELMYWLTLPESVADNSQV